MEKRIVTFLVLLLAGSIATFACNYTYTVIDAAGNAQRISEGETAILQQGGEYTLQMVYVENHRNCTVSPDQTLYLLDGSRWRVARDTQPLILTSPPDWEEPRSRTHSGEFPFVANVSGTWTLEVVRVCDRGGYTGEIHFEVQL